MTPSPLSPAGGRLEAWVDESGSDHARDPHTYLLAAAVCWSQHVDDARDTMRLLRLPGERKVHWRDDSESRHRVVTTSIAALDAIEHLVIVRSVAAFERGEHRRRKTLERLLFELATMGVDHAVFESRGPKDDARDRQLLDFMRRKRQLPAPIRIDHTRGPEEPMLWIPDAVCGMVVAMRIGTPVYYEQLKSRSTLIDMG